MTTIALPRSCDRTVARALLPEIRDSIGAQPVGIDASAVERIGQAVLQVLVSAARSESGISLIAPSRAFSETVTLTGLAEVLGCEASTSGIEEPRP